MKIRWIKMLLSGVIIVTVQLTAETAETAEIAVIMKDCMRIPSAFLCELGG